MDSRLVTGLEEKNYIKNRLNMAVRLESLAEEASELAQAALKKARILRNQNPTPITLGEANASLVEEFTDVCVSADLADVVCNKTIYDSKIHRCYKRLTDRYAWKEN